MEISTSQISRYILDLQNELKGDSPSPAHMSAGEHGIFQDAECAIMAASQAQKRLMEYSLKERETFIEAMRAAARENARKLAETAHDETGYGHVEDKVAKNVLAADKTPGIEDLNTMAVSGDAGLMLTEMAPYGVIGAITPSTNPTATVINNGIGMIAGAMLSYLIRILERKRRPF